MNNANEKQRKDRLQYWVLKLILAAIFVIMGYKTPKIWFPMCVAIWAIYAVSLITSSFLLAKPTETDFTTTVKKLLSFFGNIATAALISAPIVMGHWYNVTYFSKR